MWRDKDMTEQEWLACTNPGLMLWWQAGKVSDRKLRLFSAAWCHRVSKRLTDARSCKAVDVAELYADGQASSEALRVACQEAQLAEATELSRWQTALSEKNQQARHISDQNRIIEQTKLEYQAACCARWSAEEEAQRAAYVIAGMKDKANKALLLHDLFGNPFRTISINPVCFIWNDATLSKIAQAIYDERAFERMPILADALEDAGCDNADILNHCRQPGVHVRGCWVVDLLLGKE
jgi:hypothetical protein